MRLAPLNPVWRLYRDRALIISPYNKCTELPRNRRCKLFSNSTAIELATPEEEEQILKLTTKKWVTIACAAQSLDTSIDTLRRYVGARRTAYDKKNNTQPRFEEGVHFQRYGDGNRFRYVFNIAACKQRLQSLNNSGQQATADAMAKARYSKKA